MQKQFHGERIVFSTINAGTIRIHSNEKRKKEIKTYLTSRTKINSKWITELNVKHKTVNLLKENIKENLGGLGFGRVLKYTKT